MRSAFAVVGVLLLLVLGATLWSNDALAAPADAPAASPEAAVVPPAGAPAAAEEASTARIGANAAGADRAAAAAGEPFALRGTAVALDEHDELHQLENGVLELTVWTGNAGERVPVVVTDGAFDTGPMPRPERVTVSSLQLGGRPVRLDPVQPDPGDELPLDAGPIALRGRWLPMLTLRVLDDTTGIDLGGVVVARPKTETWQSLSHPGDEALDVLVEHGRSPLRYHAPTISSRQTLWVHAQGHAWQKVEIDATDPAERLVRLLPGGDVDLLLSGAERPRGSAVRVYTPGDTKPIVEFSRLRTQPFRMSGLPAGPVELRLELGPWFRQPTVLCRTTVDVPVGGIATATLLMEDRVERPAAVPVSGVLVVPAAWRHERCHLEIEPTGPLKGWADDPTRIGLTEMERQGDAELAFAVRGGLMPGPHLVVVEGTGFRARFTVPPGGTDELRFELPPPCEVRVRLLDAETGRPVVVEGFGFALAVWAPDPAAEDGDSTDAQLRQHDDGTWRCQSVPGPIAIMAHPAGYEWANTSHAVGPGVNEFVLQLRRVCGVRVTLVDGEAELPWVMEFHGELKTRDGESFTAYWSSDGSIAAKGPGDLILHLDPIPGFLPVDPIPVTVPPGEWVPVRVALRRK
ncbi:MAG: hypothetical protein AB7O97_08150 [Planctomycetota bacterium]